MKTEDKDLLLKDLCARLPYGVKVQTTYIMQSGERKDIGIDILTTVEISMLIEGAEEHKPYLFPLSSMSEEQKEELKSLGWNFDNFEIHNVSECLGTYREYVSHSDCFVLIDWFNKNHFDYRCLIEKGLAIDATNLNIY